MLGVLPELQRKPIQSFLTSYYNQTKRSTISLKSFIANVMKAYQLGKFELSKIVEYVEPVNERVLKDIIEKSIVEPILKEKSN